MLREAHESPQQWLDTTAKEAQSLERNRAWYPANLPKGCQALKLKWVYALNKARLVAERYSQLYGVHYYETYAPPARVTTVGNMIAIAT